MTTQLAKSSRRHHAHPELAKELVCLSSLRCLFPCTWLLMHTKPMTNTHRLKPNHTVLLLPAGKGGLEHFLFSLFLTPTEKSGIPNNNLCREDRAG